MENTVKTEAYRGKVDIAPRRRAAMSSKVYVDGYTEGFREGFTRSLTRCILYVLESRGIDVPADVRERVSSCTDLGQLDRWFDRAYEVDLAGDIFA